MELQIGVPSFMVSSVQRIDSQISQFQICLIFLSPWCHFVFKVNSQWLITFLVLWHTFRFLGQDIDTFQGHFPTFDITLQMKTECASDARMKNIIKLCCVTYCGWDYFLQQTEGTKSYHWERTKVYTKTIITKHYIDKLPYDFH